MENEGTERIAPLGERRRPTCREAIRRNGSGSSATTRTRVSALLLPLLVVGCVEAIRSSSWHGIGELGSFPETGVPRRYVHGFVEIHTDTNPRIAEEIGHVLTALRSELCDRYGILRADPPKILVHAYAQRRDYDAVATRHGLPSGKTMGCCASRGDRSIHLLFRDDLGVHPMITLLHEGTHRYLYETDADLPKAWADRLGQDRILSPPWWVHEGLATFMESARYVEGRIRAGGVNPKRLRELKRLLETGDAPPLETVLAAPHGKAYPSGYYAVAWGLVYALLEHPDPDETERRRHALQQYLRAFRKGETNEIDRGIARIFTSTPRDDDVSTALPRWHRWVAARSARLFSETFLPPGMTLPEWERAWRNEMLRR